MRASPLHPLFELSVHDIDLREVAGDTLYPDIRQTFETHSALLFPKQSIPDTDHVRIAELFGPLENREAMAEAHDFEFQVSELTKKTKDSLCAKDDLRLLELQASLL